jgi:MFS family permease
MTLMRLMIGSIFRSVSEKKILIVSFAMMLVGLILLKAGSLFYLDIMGLVFLGAGLANGFPIMLGFVGNRYAELSGTAFSLVLFIALIGNFLINYGMGIIAQNFGIHHLITVAFAESIIMMLFCVIILKKLKNK